MSDNESTIKIRFDNETVADAARKTQRLQQELRVVSGAIDMTIEKDDPSNQDFGATLVLVLGTPAIIALSKGVADYLRRDRATISIEVDGKVVATGVSGDDAAKIAKAFADATKKE